MNPRETKLQQRSGCPPKPVLEQPLSWFSALADRVRLEEAARQLSAEHPDLAETGTPPVPLGCRKATQEAK